MTIPSFDLGLALPPFTGTSPAARATQSPYMATSEELVHRFGGTPARAALLRGFLQLRSALRELGIVRGYQWIDGSFVEDKERRLGLGPGDIDVVTLFERPVAKRETIAWHALVTPHLDGLFDPRYCKARFNCDAFFIDVDAGGLAAASASSYWFSLFSHQRETYRWKGIVRCNLGAVEVDEAADAELTRRGA